MKRIFIITLVCFLMVGFACSLAEAKDDELELSVIASSVYNDEARYQPEKTLDGYRYTCWKGGKDQDPWHIQYDAGMVRRISNIYIYWSDSSYAITLPTDYDIGISEDGTNWDYISTGRKAKPKETVKIDQDARYITLLIHEVEKWTRPMLIDVTVSADANVPKLINFQGNLYEQGDPINGTRTLTFKIYDAEDAEESLWNETQGVTIEEGIFNVELGSQTKFDILFDKPYWLGIQVESDNEMDPRFRLTSTPYSLMTAE